MRLVWSDTAQATFRQFMKDDQDGLVTVNKAVSALTDDPAPAEAFVRGDGYRRLRAGRYRIMYEIEDDVITVVRVDRVPG